MAPPIKSAPGIDLAPYLSAPCEVPGEAYVQARSVAGLSVADASKSIGASPRQWAEWEAKGTTVRQWRGLAAFALVHFS